MKYLFTVLIITALSIAVAHCCSASSNNYVINNLSLEEQLLIRGGAGSGYNKDCEDQTGGCGSGRPTCNSNSDCTEGSTYCGDTTKSEACTKETTWGFDCVVDTAHTCSPKKKLSGTCCLIGETLCNSTGEDLGNCGSTTATQCHY